MEEKLLHHYQRRRKLFHEAVSVWAEKLTDTVSMMTSTLASNPQVIWFHPAADVLSL